MDFLPSALASKIIYSGIKEIFFLLARGNLYSVKRNIISSSKREILFFSGKRDILSFAKRYILFSIKGDIFSPGNFVREF